MARGWETFKWLSRHLFFISFGLASAVIIVLMLPTPETVMSITANTETLETKVTHPEAAAMGLVNARLLRGPTSRPCFAQMTIVAPVGSTILYSRYGYDKLSVTVEATTGAISVQGNEEEPGPDATVIPQNLEINTRLQVAIDPADRACRAPSAVRLPVSGNIDRLGDEIYDDPDPRDPLKTLLSGSIAIYGRATDRTRTSLVGSLSAWIVTQLSSAGMMKSDELFLADRLDLPPGSMLSAARAGNNLLADWSGFADTDFSPIGARGFGISASGYASEIDIALPAAIPAAEQNRHEEPLRISLGLFARWTSDPNLRILILFVIACSFVYRVYAWIIDDLHRKKG